jgi:hypothetical protein
VLKEILNKGKILRKVLDEKSWWQPNQESIFGGFGQLLRLYLSQSFFIFCAARTCEWSKSSAFDPRVDCKLSRLMRVSLFFNV